MCAIFVRDSTGIAAVVKPYPPPAEGILTGVKLVRRLEVDDEGQPGVVHVVPGGVALRQDADSDARK